MGLSPNTTNGSGMGQITQASPKRLCNAHNLCTLCRENRQQDPKGHDSHPHAPKGGSRGTEDTTAGGQKDTEQAAGLRSQEEQHSRMVQDTEPAQTFEYFLLILIISYEMPGIEPWSAMSKVMPSPLWFTQNPFCENFAGWCKPIRHMGPLTPAGQERKRKP